MPADGAWWDDVELADGSAELRVRPVAAGVRLVVEGPGGAIDVVLPSSVAARLGAALVEAAGAGDPWAVTSVPPERLPVVDPPLAVAVPQPRQPVAWLDPPPPDHLAAETLDRSLEHLRRLCEVLPDTAEIDGLGSPTFRAATRIFAVVEVIDDVPVVRFKATIEEQASLCSDARFRPDPDTGHHGWTAVRLDQLRAAEEAEPWLLGSFRLVAPADTVSRLDAILAAAPPNLTSPG